MNVCDRNLRQDQFEDQPIVRQFEMLFRKPFIGQFLFSLSCQSYLRPIPGKNSKTPLVGRSSQGFGSV